VLAVIRRFAADHTVIAITHDPRLTRAADDVLVLQRYGAPVPVT
jgi:ABC-type transport system involved in cytochrome bd biosynthesis fused ATPase/permease subunit